MKRNTKSMARHHSGASLQQVLAQARATNKNGVARQCTMHRKLAAAPSESDLSVMNAMIKVDMAKLVANLLVATRLH